MPSQTQDLAARYSKAWADRDVDAIVAMHTESTVFDQHGAAEPAIGRPAVRATIQALLDQTPDLAFAPRRAHFAAEHFVTEYEVSGTVAGRSFACDGVDVFSLQDGLIARKDTYIDLAGLQRQLETEPAGAAGAVS